MTTSPSSHVVTAPKGAVAYLKIGSGPAVVVAHGIGGHKEDWMALMLALAPTHTVCAFDLLGFGASVTPAPEITVADQSDALIALLDAEKLAHADLVGNSVGAWVAATAAANHPGRVRRLVLSDAAGFKAMFEGPPPVNFYPQTLDEMRQLLAAIRHDPAAHTEAHARQALSDALAGRDAEAAERIGRGLFMSERLEDVAARITAPTLVVWGAEDRLFPPAVADLVAAQVRGASRQLIPAAGHFPHLDNPEAFAAVVVDFLSH
jgi:triacylglycerol lipase